MEDDIYENRNHYSANNVSVAEGMESGENEVTSLNTNSGGEAESV